MAVKFGPCPSHGQSEAGKAIHSIEVRNERVKWGSVPGGEKVVWSREEKWVKQALVL